MPEIIKVDQDRLLVPDYPIIPFIEGDGIGSDITPAMRRVVDAAIEKAYGNTKKIEWLEVLAGEKAHQHVGNYLPEETLDALKKHIVAIKGPLTTPVGSGFRSLNVSIRQLLDLYSCIRPVRWYGSASPLKHPAKIDLVVFRENTEDVYAGVEYESGSSEAKRIINLLRELGVSEEKVMPDSAVGIKPISPWKTKRHVRKALRWALQDHRRVVTLMHKGNIMKFTEGGFMRWGYEVLEEPEFSGKFFIENETLEEQNGRIPNGKIKVNDRIADNMFQQILIRPAEYDVIASPNLNGDYLSDAAAASAGGLGLAPGANIGDHLAVFEATHGSAPKYTGQNKVNPASLILSAAMMLDYLGWKESATLIHHSLEQTLAEHIGTYDLIRGWQNEGRNRFTEVSCSGFAARMVDNLTKRNE